MNWRLALCALALVASCVRPQPAPKSAPVGPPPPPPLRIPEGCLESQGGDWVHAEHPEFQYHGEDDGGTLELALQRVGAVDAGAIVTLLHRTASGFHGATAHSFVSAGNTACSLEFPAEVVGCTDGGLLLRSATSVSIDDQCHHSSLVSPPLEMHRLTRPTLPSGDAGR